MKIVRQNDALIIVDVQNDFCPGGALPVKEGDKVIPPLNHTRRFFEHIFATQDWHPENHCSFEKNGGGWPVHCVAGSQGADFHPDLNIEQVKIIQKATLSDRDAYSGFDGTDLATQLSNKNIKRVFVGGLATDYCVKATVLDALKSGFEAWVLEDAIRGVDLEPGDSAKAITEMKEKGARFLNSSDLE